ncbi:fluoride efflux transporter CrcB [Bacillus benzoevorans]|uniref:Fluoride-specific ion channel FluC n=1 Tax=Bacillus benzoevorans TaxID=1456 RepID=A0A7X0LVB6_9BACI|nr:fluoride efflux transporter CrcB [Bacillus benzoevorans]MBB6445453.1 CrcB protein [Bacillus benzoevorans]
MIHPIWLVGLGGFLGAVSRYFFNQYFSSFKLFPLGTFLVNITGSFFMGLLLGSGWISESIRILVGTGFLGAYTTFSTFNFELFMLKKNKRKFQFFLYIVSSYIFGILLAYLGYAITNDH